MTRLALHRRDALPEMLDSSAHPAHYDGLPGCLDTRATGPPLVPAGYTSLA